MQQIGRFEIIEELGRGSMGAVYKARDPRIDRIVAIKIILTATLDPENLQEYRLRFQREAQAAGRLTHGGIVAIHDIEEDESGQPYLVMEFVEGTPLDKLLRSDQERPPLGKILDIAAQVAKALDYAHHRGVVHRDIKPANIMVTADGIAKIADFGIAKLAGTQLTQVGQLVGTPAFMSPEQFSGSAVDGRSDLFSLGAVIYWMVTGERPFAGDTITSMTFKVVYSAHIPATQLQASLPPALDTVIGRALAKNPADRYQTCAELAADLEAVQDGKAVAATPAPAVVERTMIAGGGTMVQPAPALPAPSPAKKPVGRMAAAGLALFLVLAGGGYWLSRQNDAPKDSSPATTPATTPAATAPAATPAPAPKPPPPVPLSRLHVVCEHNFESGRLEITSGGKVVLNTPLRGERQVTRVFAGSLSITRTIPAGERTLRVKVTSPKEKYDDHAEISGEFAEGAIRTLHIAFGKGSGLGIFSRKLTVAWQ